jgi:predicted enzyme related to lactoylglutathione lyase
VLGWRFSPGRVPDGWAVEDVVPMTGMHGGHDEATVVPMYRVDDVVAAVERVRAAGGSSTDPERRPYGLSADCVDNQGTRFYLGET